ncbi:unnamed protein product, partial [Amoebophrya sp. A25]|eukprot:GSA25T00016278001.1
MLHIRGVVLLVWVFLARISGRKTTTSTHQIPTAFSEVTNMGDTPPPTEAAQSAPPSSQSSTETARTAHEDVVAATQENPSGGAVVSPPSCWEYTSLKEVDLSQFSVAACDLDGYKNLLAAQKLMQKTGGTVFPVTGHNPSSYQLHNPDWAVANNPGVYLNGALIQDFGGKVLESTTMSEEQMRMLLEFEIDVYKSVETKKFGDFGLLFLTDDGMISMEIAGAAVGSARAKRRTEAIEGYRKKLGVSDGKYLAYKQEELTKAICSAKETEGDGQCQHVYHSVFVWPENPEAEGGSDNYASLLKGHITETKNQLEERSKPSASGGNNRLIFTIRDRPWPSIDVLYNNVNKASGIVTLINKSKKQLGFPEHVTAETIIGKHLMVFGDSGADVSLFKPLKLGEEVEMAAALQVAMPESDSEIRGHAKCISPVDEVLQTVAAVRVPKPFAGVLAAKKPGLLNRLSLIAIGACDLDKTLFPGWRRDGEENGERTKNNLVAAYHLKETGGFAFPVTGNNPPMAQAKFNDAKEMMADNPEALWDVYREPGVFLNGALVQGPGGTVVHDQPMAVKIVKKLVELDKDPNKMKEKAGGYGNFGLFFFTRTGMASVRPADGQTWTDGMKEAQSAVLGYAGRQEIPDSVTWHNTHEELLDLVEKKEITVYQAVFVWPLWSKQYSGDIPEADPITDNDDADTMRTKRKYALDGVPGSIPKPSSGEKAPSRADLIQTLGGVNRLADAVLKGGDGAFFDAETTWKAMSAPWPSIDVTTKGTNKGSSLVRLLSRESVRKALGIESGMKTKDLIEERVAVFGDAQNDLEMFQ